MLSEVAGSFINDIYTRLRRFVLLASFILVDTGQAFVTDWAERRTASDVQSSGRRTEFSKSLLMDDTTSGFQCTLHQCVQMAKKLHNLASIAVENYFFLSLVDRLVLSFSAGMCGKLFWCSRRAWPLSWAYWSNGSVEVLQLANSASISINSWNLHQVVTWNLHQ